MTKSGEFITVIAVLQENLNLQIWQIHCYAQYDGDRKIWPWVFLEGRYNNR